MLDVIQTLVSIYSETSTSGQKMVMVNTFFWLNGMAGTGKSTVSRTVAQTFADRGQLGGSFFFKRGERDRENASLLFTTIVHELVR